MVHVRKIDGEPVLFGNHGALFMNAMTWWDHKTGSVWSQVWGRAIEGPLKGTELELLTSSTVPWGTWKAQHPNTLLMTNDLGGFRFGRRARFQPDYVIGIEFDGVAKAYPYRVAECEKVINDEIGGRPVLIYVDPETHAVSTFFRVVDGQTLTFRRLPDVLKDRETDSTWDSVRGLAIAGPLKGKAMRSVPHVPAYDWAWRDFYPYTEFYDDYRCAL